MMRVEDAPVPIPAPAPAPLAHNTPADHSPDRPAPHAAAAASAPASVSASVSASAQGQEQQQRKTLETKAEGCAPALRSTRHASLDALSIHVPYLSDVYLLGKRWTLLEALIVAALLVGIPASSSPVLASIMAAAALVLAARHNVLSYLAGISFERALVWHKVAAYSTFLVSTTHGISAGLAGRGASGLLMVGAFAGLGIFSVIFIRQKAFELFYYSHLSMLVLLGVGSAFHGAPIVFVGLAVTAVDFILRFAKMRKVSATLIRLPADVTRIEFDKGNWSYEAGQYVFVCIPSLGPQFHPFSLSSAPHISTAMLHARALGNWTKTLNALTREDDCKTKQCTMYVEGPYGSLSIDLFNAEKYKVVMLISGGIGITPMQSIASDLVHKQRQGRKLKKVIFVWSVREADMGDQMIEELENAVAAPLPPSFQPLLLPSVGSSRSILSNNSEDPSDEVLHTEFYLTQTGKKDSSEVLPADPQIRFGRPNLKDLFERVSKYAIAQHEQRIAVCTCGPTKMVSEVEDICRLSSQAGNGLRFDCHKEVFQF